MQAAVMTYFILESISFFSFVPRIGPCHENEREHDVTL